MKAIKHNYYGTIILVFSILAIGGYYDFAIAGSGLLICIGLIIKYFTKHTFYQMSRNFAHFIPYILLIISVLVTFVSVDRIQNLVGSLRFLVVILWIYYIRNSEEDEKRLMRLCIPWVAFGITIVSIATYFIPGMSELFWENSRMSGVFTYANTCGMFCLLGIMLQLSSCFTTNTKTKSSRIINNICLLGLLLGLLLTGSRSVLLLLLLYVIYFMINNKSARLPLFISMIVLIVLGIGYILITGNMQNVGRIFSIFTTNSTMWGRLLYYKDAINMIAKNPFGLGFLGYSYVQGLYQSGVYTLRMVHNDFLQVALDYGIIALALLLMYLGYQFIKGNQDKSDKVILAFLCLSGLIDFNFQYLSMIFCAILFMDFGKTNKKIPAKSLKENLIIHVLCSFAMLYLTIAFLTTYIGDSNISNSMLPGYIPAKLNALNNSTSAREQLQICNEILSNNGYEQHALYARATIALYQADYKNVMADMDSLIKLVPYEVDAYKKYAQYINMLIEYYEKTDSSEEILISLNEKKDSIPVLLASQKERTSDLAYKIKDIPSFDMN